ncbi:MAG: STAS domain-containing protein [Acidimicrobiia bacterium]
MMVTVIGEVDLASSPVVSKELDKRSGRVVVDLRKVDFMDSTGIRLLLAHHERLDQKGGHLRILVKKDQQLTRLLEISGLTDIFDIAEALHPHDEDDPSPTTLV